MGGKGGCAAFPHRQKGGGRVNNKRTALVRGSKLLHFMLTVGLFAYTWFRFLSDYNIVIARRYQIWACLLYGLLLYFFCRTYNAYLIEYSRITDIVFSLCLSTSVSLVLMYVGIMVAWQKYYPPRYFILLLLLQLLVNLGWAVASNKSYYAHHQPAKTLLVYRNQEDLMRLNEVKRFPKKYKVVRVLEDPKTYKEVVKAMSGCDTVFMAGVNANLRNGVAKHCMENGIHSFFLPHVGDIILMSGTHVPAFSIPIVSLQNTRNRLEYLWLKRGMDVLLSAAAIAVFSPLMLLIAVAIKLDDGGPVFYRQERLTKGGKVFRICKFRSMRPDAEKDGVPRLSTGEKDERITRVGNILRVCRLDELPQLFNIFKGDMTIVGPRPERPEIAAQYTKSMPAFKLRLKVKAGLTGYAQVYGRYNTDPYDKLEMDLIYINKMNPLMDLQLMIATVRILFVKESTSGVEEGNTTALQELQKK